MCCLTTLAFDAARALVRYVRTNIRTVWEVGSFSANLGRAQRPSDDSLTALLDWNGPHLALSVQPVAYSQHRIQRVAAGSQAALQRGNNSKT